MVSEAQEERTLEAKAMTVKHVSAFVMPVKHKVGASPKPVKRVSAGLSPCASSVGSVAAGLERCFYF